MWTNDPDKDWETLAKTDPYWAVVTNDRYHSSNLDSDSVEAFFASGQQHVDDILRTVRNHVAEGFAPRRALDFGCGVGRVLIPLSRVCAEVVGVDVSEAMLIRAAENSKQRGITNAEFVRGDDKLSRLVGDFDFIHSYIVFQHIPVERGLALAAGLLKRLRPGGVGALHFTYDVKLPPLSAALLWARTSVPLANSILNVVLLRTRASPIMQLNRYPFDRLIAMIQDASTDRLHLILTDHDGPRGAMMLFRKSPPVHA